LKDQYTIQQQQQQQQQNNNNNRFYYLNGYKRLVSALGLVLIINGDASIALVFLILSV